MKNYIANLKNSGTIIVGDNQKYEAETITFGNSHTTTIYHGEESKPKEDEPKGFSKVMKKIISWF